MLHTLDERDPPNMHATESILIPEVNGTFTPVRFNIRPYLKESLLLLREKYQIIAFSGSDELYANALLDFIDPFYEIFEARLYRQHCVQTPYGLIKDLRVIKNRHIKDMLMVGSNATTFAFNVENGIPILPFYDNFEDNELEHLSAYLLKIYQANVYDVRLYNREAFGLSRILPASLMDEQK
jgi:CTD small phosphatase-like protein 2